MNTETSCSSQPPELHKMFTHITCERRSPVPLKYLNFNLQSQPREYSCLHVPLKHLNFNLQGVSRISFVEGSLVPPVDI